MKSTISRAGLEPNPERAENPLRTYSAPVSLRQSRAATAGGAPGFGAGAEATAECAGAPEAVLRPSVGMTRRP